MALTITSTGSEISTEKLVFSAVSDDIAVTSVLMDVLINGTAVLHQIEHLPILGTTSTFNFEINSIIKDYFASEFLPLTGANQTAIENAIVALNFFEVIGTAVQVTQHKSSVVIKNMTQDTFDIEDFDLNDYDCGDTGSALSKLLTSSPNPLPIGDKTSVHLSCLTSSYTAGMGGSLTPNQEWLVQTLLNGVLVSTTTEAVDVPARSITSFVNSGKYDIANYRFDFDINNNIDEVRILIRDIASPFTTRSETRVFKLNNACERSITLSWLNEYGTQDTFTFLGNIERKGKYTDKSFKRVRPVNPLSTNVGDLVYKSDYNYQYDIFSDRMPELSVKWLSKILVNKRAAIQSEVQIFTVAYLYNFFALNGGVVGDGRAVGGIVNTSIAAWSVPTNSDYTTLFASQGGAPSAGGRMKEIGFDNWDSPNTGANNLSKFTALGKGTRSDATGVFSQTKTAYYSWTGDVGGSGENGISLFSGTSSANSVIRDNKTGMSVRLVRPAVGGEVDGQILKFDYTGNNGDIYDGVVIGTQVWLMKDLQETKYNDGSTITNETDATTWGGLATGAMCIYDNGSPITKIDGKYFPIIIETDETVLDDKFTPETIFRLKFRLANRRKGLK